MNGEPQIPQPGVAPEPAFTSEPPQGGAPPNVAPLPASPAPKPATDEGDNEVRDMVPMISPDGKWGQVPRIKASAAVQKKFKVAAFMLSQEGKRGLVPLDRVHDALAKGLQLAGGAPRKPAKPEGLQYNKLDAATDILAGIGETDPGMGAAIGVGKDVARTGAEIANLVPGVDINTEPLKPKSGAETVGGVAGEIAQFMLGEGALKGALKAIPYAARVADLSRITNLLEKYPALGRILGAGLRAGAVGGAQTGVHTHDPGEAAESALETGGMGAGLGAVGEGIEALKPGEQVIAGERVPTLASQEGVKGAGVAEGVAKTAGYTGHREIAKFVEGQGKAAERAAGNMAEESVSHLNRAEAVHTPKPVEGTTPEAVSAELKARAAQQQVGSMGKTLPAKVRGPETQLVKETGSTAGTIPGKTLEEVPKPSSTIPAKTVEARSFKEAADALGKEVAAAKGAGKAKLNGQADAMRQLADAWDRSIAEAGSKGARLDGATWLAELDKLGDTTLKAALHGNGEHVKALKQIGELLKSGQNVTKLNNVARLLRGSSRGLLFFPSVARVGELAAAETGSLLLGKILTNARAARAVANGLKIGASTPVVAREISEAYSDEQ